jgi:hypothetical protein
MNYEKTFESPGQNFRPVPWWLWTGQMDLDQMRHQLEDMSDKGIHEFFVCPIYGLEIPYLSEQWWERINFTLEHAQRLGMKVWIYDDYNWPSGTCAGFVLRDFPEYMGSKLKIEVVDINENGPLEYEFKGKLLSVAIQDEGKKAFVASKDQLKQWSSKGLICITKGITGRLVISSSVLDNTLRLFSIGSIWASHARGNIDVTCKKAIEKFIEYTHEQYKKRCGNYFGKIIPGFFTDEPSLEAATWPHDFPQIFQNTYGYDLHDKIHELVIEEGDYLTTRLHYWSLLTKLFSNNYMKQISDWCQNNNLIHTGHLLREERLQTAVEFSGDNYTILKSMQAPGLDLLGKYTSYDSVVQDNYKTWDKLDDPRAFIITAKLASSTRRFSSRGTRVMCEAFGIRDWTANLKEQKKITDWLTALGVDLINDNTLSSSIEDFRKRHISGKHFTTPWWKYYKLYSDYCARLCSIVNKGELDARVAVLYPTTSAWAMKPLCGPATTKEWQLMQESLLAVVDGLLRTHWDFELIFEDVISNSAISENGELVTQNGRFKCLILPAIGFIDTKAYNRLEEFLKAGGTLLTVENNPQFSADAVAGVKTLTIDELHGTKVIHLNKDSQKFESEIDNILSNNINREFSISGQDHRNVLSATRLLNGQPILFLSNQHGGPKDLEIRWTSKANPYEWNPDNGNRFQLSSQSDGTGFSTKCHLHPCQSTFIVLNEKQEKLPVKITAGIDKATKENIKNLTTRWHFTTETPNLFLPFLSIRIDSDGIGEQEKWFALDSHDSDWSRVDEERTDFELRPEKIQNFWLKSQFHIKDSVPEDLYLIVDSNRYGQAYLNGCKLEECSTCTVWDSSNLKFRLSAKLGDNLLVIKANPSKYYSTDVGSRLIDSHYVDFIDSHFIDPVVLSGSFRVEERDVLVQSSVNINTGSWTNQGYPNFAGTGVYSQEVIIPYLTKKVWLRIEGTDEAVEVWINGKFCNIRLWPPYQYDITDFVVKGVNVIVIKITNNFGNLFLRRFRSLKGERKDAGIIGNVAIIFSD